MIAFIRILLVTISFASFVSVVEAKSDLMCTPHGKVRGDLCQVSLSRLIANPSQFSGKNVRVIGFLANSPEGLMLFASEEAASVSDISNGILVDLESNSELRRSALNSNRSIVRVIGKFSSEPALMHQYEYSAGQLSGVAEIAKAGVPWGLRPMDERDLGSDSRVQSNVNDQR